MNTEKLKLLTFNGITKICDENFYFYNNNLINFQWHLYQLEIISKLNNIKLYKEGSIYIKKNKIELYDEIIKIKKLITFNNNNYSKQKLQKLGLYPYFKNCKKTAPSSTSTGISKETDEITSKGTSIEETDKIIIEYNPESNLSTLQITKTGGATKSDVLINKSMNHITILGYPDKPLIFDESNYTIKNFSEINFIPKDEFLKQKHSQNIPITPATASKIPITPIIKHPKIKNIYLYFNKYNKSDIKTKMEKDEFYINLINNYKKIYNDGNSDNSWKGGTIYITNGINKKFTSGGSGTNDAITKLNKNCNDIFFNKTKIEMIYDSSKNDQQGLLSFISNPKQTITFDSKTYYSGSIFKTEKCNLNGFKLGVYHINGTDMRVSSPKLQLNKIEFEKYQEFSKKYYSELIKDFLKNTTVNGNILHLAQIPGEIFGGGDEVIKGMLEAIKNIDNNNNNRNILISLDMNIPAKADSL